jgi:hypothetical protein
MRTVQIPEDVYQQASVLAEQDHVSVDRLIASLVRDGVEGWTKLQQRASVGSSSKLQSVLGKIGGGPPISGDEL